MPSVSAAQGPALHWDIGAQVGVTDRVATGGGVPARSPGPSAEIHGHVAILPMLRVGPYAAFDVSPTSGLPARGVYSAGLRAKVTPPWLAAPWRAWGFLGIGAAYAYMPSSASAQAATATLPELPVGIGVGYRLRGAWEACAELGMRWDVSGLGGGGPRPANASMPFVGNDLFAVSLSLGVSLTE